MAIMVLIIVNAITLGLETDKAVMNAIGPILLVLDKLVLTIFAIEVFEGLANLLSRNDNLRGLKRGESHGVVNS